MINLLQTNVDTDSKKKDAVDAGPADLQSSPEVNAEQALKGLGSKTVNYNLSNKRPLVHLQVLCFMLMLAAMQFCSFDTVSFSQTTDVVQLCTCDAGRHGLWDVLSGAAVLCLDGCVGGEQTCNVLLVGRLYACICLVLAGLMRFCINASIASQGNITPIYMRLVSQGVYADAYISASGNLGPTRSAIGLNELNQYNGRIALASQKLVLQSTSAGIASQREQ